MREDKRYDYRFITLSAREFSRVTAAILDSARRALREGTQLYLEERAQLFPDASPEELNPVLERLAMLKSYERLATDMAYLRATRLPLLPPSAMLTFRFDEGLATNFVRALKGEAFSLRKLVAYKHWFELCATATDSYIPKKKIKRIAERYDAKGLPYKILKKQIHDDFCQAAAMEVLKRSKTGEAMRQMAADYGYEMHFVDLRLFNLNRVDRGEGQGSAVCYSTGAMFMDTGSLIAESMDMSIRHAIVLAHECGHAVQFYRHLTAGIFADKKSAAGFYYQVRKHISTLEAHSIGTEYVVASELLASGLDSESIYDAIKNDLRADIVNLLHDRPEEFLQAVASSDEVREGWNLKAGQTAISPKMIKKFAASLPRLNSEWVSQPETEAIVIDSLPPVETIVRPLSWRYFMPGFRKSSQEVLKIS